MLKSNSDIAVQNSNLKKDDIQSLLEIAKAAAIKGGGIIKSHYGKITSISNKGRLGDLVTNADVEAEKTIIDYLNSMTPEISILAEESGLSEVKSELKWCIDPLDGTTNFAHGYPFYATSIGLTFKDIPIVGAISIPSLNELYLAAPGIGAFCNDEQIYVSECKKLSESLLVTGFAYDRQTEKDNNYAEFCWLTHRTRGVRRGGAAAVDLAFTANGRVDGYWERGLAQWDVAAGVVLVEQAGGIIKDYKSDEFDITSGRVLACSPKIESELRNELSKVIPLETKLYGMPEI